MSRETQYGTTFELKAVDTSQRIISGYAAVHSNLDRVGDIIDPSAFRKTLTEKRPQDIAIFIGHRQDDLPIGRPLSLTVDAKGLFTESYIFPGPMGDQLLETAKALHAAGDSLGLSIGYRARGSKFERGVDGKTVRRLTDIDLMEYSFAARQSIANPEARTVGVKAVDDDVEPVAAAESAALEELKMDETPILWDAAYLATLPDSAFLRVDPGEQENGRTVPATKRHWAYRDAEGKIAVDRLAAVLPALTGEPILQGRVQWLLAQPESKLADADTPEWQQGAAPRTYAAAHRLLALPPRMAAGQKSARDWDRDTHEGQQMRPTELAELDAVIAELKTISEMAHLVAEGTYERGRSARWRQEIDLLELAV